MVAAGPWVAWLPIDRAVRYTDVTAVVPRPPSPSVAGVDGRDAAELLAALPRLPGAGEEDRPVTLDRAALARALSLDGHTVRLSPGG
jgi:hypothetical protein